MSYRASINSIVDDQLYLGNLFAAQTPSTVTKLGITHILSVCHDNPLPVKPNIKRAQIKVNDEEYDDLLIHLPKACAFIDEALRENGAKVLVHCYVGVSRSATVVCAYLMMSRQWDPQTAIRFVRQKRPLVHLNYGFLQQLFAFSVCSYNPSPTHPQYLKWKASHVENVTNFLHRGVDFVEVGDGHIVLNTNFPATDETAMSFLTFHRITHVLYVSPSAAEKLKGPARNIVFKYWESTNLQEPCTLIQKSFKYRGNARIMVHSLMASRACEVIAAYLMSSLNLQPSEALDVLKDAVPLFVAPPRLLQSLESFAVSSNDRKQVDDQIQKYDVTANNVRADWERYTSLWDNNG